MADAEPGGSRVRRPRRQRRGGENGGDMVAAEAPPAPNPSPPQAGGGGSEASPQTAGKLDRKDPRTPVARRLRREATPFERRLWAALRLLELPPGSFRRQAPIGPCFADFAHHGLKLVVELDGEQHGHDIGLRRDAVRTAYLESVGYRVLRFWNHEIRENLDGIVETILAAAPTLSAPGPDGTKATPHPQAPTGPIPC